MERRFRFDDDDSDDEDNMEDFDMDEFLDETVLIDASQMQLVERDQNQRLLQDVINFLQKSFFWRFRKNETKLKMINQTYQEFVSMIDANKIKEI
jgi:ABC-type uncharacterized transport system substrate-binding protein